jgi:SlyX protein
VTLKKQAVDKARHHLMGPHPKFMSNSGMDHPDLIDNRLNDLEIKASFAEDLLDQLNQVIIRQQQQIDRLISEVGHLRQQVPDGSPGLARSPREELPPHY